MKIERAIEMVEALLLDNEMGIDTLGSYGDDVAIALYKEVVRLSIITRHNEVKAKIGNTINDN